MLVFFQEVPLCCGTNMTHKQYFEQTMHAVIARTQSEHYVLPILYSRRKQ